MQLSDRAWLLNPSGIRSSEVGPDAYLVFGAMSVALPGLTSPSLAQIGFLLIWVLMVVLLAIGLAALVNARALPDASFRGSWKRVSNAVLTADPRQKSIVLRYLVGLLNSMAGVLALNYGAQRGVIDPEACRQLTVGALAVGLLWYVVMRLGWNKRLADPSLAEPQMMSAIVLLSWGYVIGGPGRPIALMLLFIILMFSMFSITIRQLMRSSGLAIVVFAMAFWQAAVQEQSTPFMAEMQAVYFGVLIIMLTSVCLLMTHLTNIRRRSVERKNELAEALARIQELAVRDELTGLFNRRHMLEVLGTERARADRSGHPWCVGLIDVDRFKAVNDGHGHGVGDEVLRSVARVIHDGLRDADQVARWGGEEFLVMFPDTDCDGAQLVLQRIRETLTGTLVSRAVPDLKVTFSAGVSCFTGNEPLAFTIDRADQALYLAKAKGRDRTERLPAGPGPSSLQGIVR